MATSRPMRESRPRYTTPMPPCPSTPTISYLPICFGTGRSPWPFTLLLTAQTECLGGSTLFCECGFAGIPEVELVGQKLSHAQTLRRVGDGGGCEVEDLGLCRGLAVVIGFLAIRCCEENAG